VCVENGLDVRIAHALNLPGKRSKTRSLGQDPSPSHRPKMIIYAMSHEPTWYIHGRAVASRGWQAGNADPTAAVLAAGSEATLETHASGGQHVYLCISARLRRPCRQALWRIG
jgi:hypothetical protein